MRGSKRGPPPNLYRVQKAGDAFGRYFGLSVEREGRDLGLTHNLRTSVIDPTGRLARILRGSDWAPEEVAAELRKSLAR